jgi:hypothetical protein
MCAFPLSRPSSIEGGCISFDYLVGELLEMQTHVEAERLGYSLIVRTTLEVGRLALAEPFTCFKIVSS